MSRPKLEVDEERFELLCGQHKTKKAICRELGIGDERTLDRWCRRRYNSGFSEVMEKKREEENTSLIEDARVLARRNPAVMIFLLKNWCGYKDSPEDKERHDGFSEDMQQWFAKVKGRDDEGTDS